MRYALPLCAVLLALLCPGATGSAEGTSQAAAGLEAYFAKRSYAPGSIAWLAVKSSRRSLTVVLFRAGAEKGPTRGRSTMRGMPVAPKQVVRWTRDGWGSVRVRLQYWPSGVYFARIRAGGQIYFAPFVLRATPNIRSRVAVIMPTNTPGRSTTSATTTATASRTRGTRTRP